MEGLLDSSGDGVAGIELDFDFAISDEELGGAIVTELFGDELERRHSVRDQSQLGRRQSGSRRALRIRPVPIIRYRTEIRDGRQVQVPYTEYREQSYAVTVPQMEQMAGMAGELRAAYEFQLPQVGQQVQNYSIQVPSGGPMSGGGQTQRLMLGGAVNWDAGVNSDGTLDHYFGNDFTLNGLTAAGKFLTVNGRDRMTLKNSLANKACRSCRRWLTLKLLFGIR